MKKIIISHGDKGGCGKSMVATILGSFFELKGVPFLLIEADAEESSGQPDVAPRFQDSSFGTVVTVPLSGKKAATDLIADLFDIIEQSESNYIVINTPAGASAILQDVSELIGEASAALGYELIIFYSLFKTDAALKLSERVLEGKLASYSSEFIFVKNEFFGIPELNHKLKKVPCVTIQTLHRNVLDRVKSDQNFSDAINKLGVLQQIQIHQWFRGMEVSGLFDFINEDEFKEVKVS